MWQLVVIAVVVVAAIMSYNSLVRLRETSEAAWADIDVQLKRRYDAIPNIVETVKGYAKHEKETLESVVAARSGAMSARGPRAKAQAEGALAGAMNSLFALAEAYPDLQAAGGFRDLQSTLGQIESQFSEARRHYNTVVREFNTKTQTFPSVFIARSFGFTEREFFEVAEAERAVPKVSFGDDD